MYNYSSWSPTTSSIAVATNENTNGYMLERSPSARTTLQAAFDLIPGEQEDEQLTADDSDIDCDELPESSLARVQSQEQLDRQDWETRGYQRTLNVGIPTSDDEDDGENNDPFPALMGELAITMSQKSLKASPTTDSTSTVSTDDYKQSPKAKQQKPEAKLTAKVTEIATAELKLSAPFQSISLPAISKQSTTTVATSSSTIASSTNATIPTIIHATPKSQSQSQEPQSDQQQEQQQQQQQTS